MAKSPAARQGLKYGNLVLSFELIMWISHRKEIRKLTFRALALRRSQSRNCCLRQKTFLSKATVYAPVCTTNPQIPIVICCIHLHIHHMSFWEHLRDVEKDDKNASKPVARHFNLPNHSMQHMTVCRLSLHQGNAESRKTLEQKIIFQIGTLNPHGINERFSFN